MILMKKITDWDTIASESFDGFDSTIKKRLATGWQPYGFPIIFPDQKGKTQYRQVLVKYEELPTY